MKIKRWIAFCLAGFLVISNTGFAHTAFAQSTIPVIQADAVHIVAPGQKFSVILEENVSTGYSWNYTSNRDAFPLVNEKIEDTSAGNSGEEPMVGAPSQKMWTFTAGKEGIYTLLFFYDRPWEKGTPPCKTMTYTIEIMDDSMQAQ